MQTVIIMRSCRVLATPLPALARPVIRQQQLRARLFTPGLGQPGLRKLSSTIIGASGREYVPWRSCESGSITPNSTYRAECVDFQGQSFVAKRVSHSFFQLSQEQKKEFPHSQHVRMHVDYNEKEIVLVYDYYKHTFLALLSQHPEFPPAEIKKILRCTAEDAKDLLDKDWNISVSHSPHFAPLKQITNPSDFEDVKPDNILVDWEYDAQGEPKVDKVALGDFDIALKLVDEQPLRASHAVGNVMWRSPEGQSGKSLAKASDIYSLGLVCIYGLGGGSMLILDDDTIKQLKENGMPPEQEIVVRHFMYFGPLPDGLLKHVDDEKWTILFRAASEIAETEAAEDPDCRFERWPVDHAPHLTQEAKNIITNMTRLDLAQRANIDEALKHPWWRLAEPS